MATLSSSAEQTSDLLQKLSLDSQTKTLDMPEPTNKIQPSDRSVTPVLSNFMDPTVCYLPNGYPSYYYGGYNGTGEWDDYSKYLNTEGVDMTSGNGSAMYPHGYWYGPYGPYSPAASPVPTMGNDAADQKSLPVEAAKENSNGIANGGDVKGTNGAVPYKPKYQNSNGRGSYTKGIPASGYKDLRSCFDKLQPDIPLLDSSVLSNGLYRNTEISSSFPKASHAPSSRNQNFHQNSHFMGWQHPGLASTMGSTHGYMNRMYSNKFYSQYGNGYKSSMGFGSGGYNSGINGQGWLPIDSKYKPKGRGNGYFGYRNENVDGLNELNRGPRAKGYFKNQKGFVPPTVAVSGQSNDTNAEEKDKTTEVPDREQYNKADFPVDYADAKFFIIKSYSEDDVHKCIKYHVWASTPNGNKKLDAAYQEAEQKSGGCPVFLLFSVNTSGQFVGLAEMTGRVDFDKSVEYWQQDKWTGYFPVKWHFVKDVPNSLLKHITLENNENKPCHQQQGHSRGQVRAWA
ncbi:YTH YT521-B HOMOLOGY DOMAIN-CONTAINING [Salix purpurea]|uniref:YTH domain-containing family protein n=1 Tax=Salix purpurea TaxID=77065 RepID=A0A9Q0TL41_SALPP|nr:YTH YT521-B HOMOLOGY DOMAIN-CONTAINING [Salix purpurea]